MDLELDLLLLGLSHRTAPVELRERSAVSAEALPAKLAELAAQPGVAECLLLSTCNRTELLVAGPHDATGPALERALRARFFDRAPEASLYAYRGVHAVIHLFRVAAGLDSLVLGESQILAQVKEAWRVAEDEGRMGKLLKPLLRQALEVGKRVRNETEVGKGTLSVARVGVEIASQVFGRDLAGCRALVIGAGETALLVARHLAERGAHELVFANRSIEHAREAAEALGGRAAGLEELPELLRETDLVLPCVDGAPGLVHPGLLDKRALARRDRPLLLIDLSVPRAVAPSLAALDAVLVYDLDDLARVVHENRRERERATEGSDEILVAEVHKFLSLRTYAAFSPSIADLRHDFASVRDELLETWRAGPGQGTPPDPEAMLRELERRLLDAALARMKESARRARPAEALSREYQRFLEEL